MRRSALAGAALLVTAALGLAAGAARGQHGHADHGDHHRHADAPAPAPAPGRRVTAEALHRSGGVPPGWRFTLPPGDPARGREVFVRLECYQCHGVRGETFPGEPDAGARRGPDLTGVGAHHPAEYLAESIVSPNAVIVEGPGHVGPDGRSTMPDFADSLTVAELIDLVAYLKSLTAEADHGAHAAGAAEAERTVGPYRIRLVYHPPGTPGAEGGRAGTRRARPGHLMAFVTDAVSGAPVPYLPVTATPRGGAASRPVTLAPMVDDHGFHYGVDVTLPAGTRAVVLAIGAAALRTAGPVAGRYAKPVTAVFDVRPGR